LQDRFVPRQQLTPGALYTLLNAELERLHPRTCTRCQMPLPYRIERPDDVSANWRIGTPAPCAHGCDIIIAEIAARMWPQYDLLDLSKPARTDADHSS
jgi:hypothetical protein